MAGAREGVPGADRRDEAGAQVVVPQPPRPEDMDEEASRRILEDDSLATGDIVSTRQGLFEFRGRPTENGSPRILFGFAELRSISTNEVLTCADDSARRCTGTIASQGSNPCR
jgi:hypothetical protein